MSLNSLKKRIEYRGGERQVDRMIEDKQRSLNKALLYSYQSATAVLEDSREFRCLINPNKISLELDDKMLSIPFNDLCLTSQKKEDIGVKCGDVITWKETNTHWIIYSQYLQERAYFRGLMRQCENEAFPIEEKSFYYYLKGPDEKSIDWQKTKSVIFNNLNYSLEVYISNTIETKQFFHRFKKLKIKEKPFEVQAVDEFSINGILIVYLKEDYTNEWDSEEAPAAPDDDFLETDKRIVGPIDVYPYDIIEYKILNANGGEWKLSNDLARILEMSDTSVKIEITTGKSGNVSLIYDNTIKLDIKILSL